MYRKSVVQCEQLFSSAGHIVSKSHLSLEPNAVKKLVCLLSVDISVRKLLCYLWF